MARAAGRRRRPPAGGAWRACALLAAAALPAAPLLTAAPLPGWPPGRRRPGAALGRRGAAASTGPEDQAAAAAVACETEQGRELERLLREDAAPLREFDERLAAACGALRPAADGEGEGGASLEGLLAAELQERLRADLLYLSALRSYVSEGIPQLPRLGGECGQTWAICPGAELWAQQAGERAKTVKLRSRAGERKAARRVSLGGRAELGGLLDAYLAREQDAALGRQHAEGGAFAGLLEQFKAVAKQAMIDVGGAGGLPDRNRTAEEAPVPIVTGLEGGGRPSDEALQHFALFSNIMENTRMAQADVYFGHVLFGLLLQRLGRRFALLRGAGMLEPASDAARMRAQLERSVADAPRGAAAAQFESFAAGLAAEPEAAEGLRRALELSPATLAAARRHTSFVFGRGLREEIFRPLARASRASGGAGEGGAKVEHCSPFLLEAASCGELRMLSAGTEARERLAWDGVLLGALLHGAEARVEAG